MTGRAPLGPVGIITPWNTPFMLFTWKIAPALAAGCTVVHKPAEFSPLSARLLVEIAEEAGLPLGVWNLVNGLDEEAGKALTEHPLIRAIGFVGESRTGSMIMAQGAKTLKRVHFELGGKNPVIVFADADIDRAVDAAVFMIYSLNGERCTSSSRLLVEATIYDSFTAKVAARAKSIKVGHPLDPQTEVSPLIHPIHEAKVLEYFDITRADGATVAAGGTKATGPGGGCYVQPTLFTNARNGMRIAQEEIFGPVLTAIPFADEAEVLAIANDVPYGLAAFGPRLHHTAFWVPTPLNIINLLDLMATTGYVKNIERAPGRHGISNVFFLYVRDPDGHRIEIYCSVYQAVDPDIEPIKWDLKDPQRQTLWGAPAPRSRLEEGSLFAGLEPKEATLKAQPIIAP